jgi:hypothetical protein
MFRTRVENRGLDTSSFPSKLAAATFPESIKQSLQDHFIYHRHEPPHRPGIIICVFNRLMACCGELEVILSPPFERRFSLSGRRLPCEIPGGGKGLVYDEGRKAFYARHFMQGSLLHRRLLGAVVACWDIEQMHCRSIHTIADQTATSHVRGSNRRLD